MAPRNSTTKGFARTSRFLDKQIRGASEARGFAQSRLLTHWEEIVGPDVAGISRPVDVKYGRGSFGATLRLLTTGANAPILEMQKEAIRTKVNAVYGYNAITRVQVTQTAATGFSEGRVSFEHRSAPKDTTPAPITPEARAVGAGVGDDGLRTALERLASNVYSKSKART